MVELPEKAGRELTLDCARVVAMVAMVFGHTADALLAESIRLWPAVQTYWKFRGLTAPMFLLVSGWAFSMASQKLSGSLLFRRFALKAVVLLLAGLALRLPLWDVGGFIQGDLLLWHHFLGFDALQLLAFSLALCTVLFAVSGRRWVRTAGLLLIAGAAATLGRDCPLSLAQLCVGDLASPFPFFPWTVFFVAGALLGLWNRQLPQGRLRGAVFVVMGGAGVMAARMLPMAVYSATHPSVLLQRLAGVVCVLGLIGLLPERWLKSARAISGTSLGVYGFHLLVLFGVWWWAGLVVRVGRDLSLFEVLGVSAALLISGVVLTRGFQQIWAGLPTRSSTREPVAQATSALFGEPRT